MKLIEQTDARLTLHSCCNKSDINGGDDVQFFCLLKLVWIGFDSAPVILEIVVSFVHYDLL